MTASWPCFRFALHCRFVLCGCWNYSEFLTYVSSGSGAYQIQSRPCTRCAKCIQICRKPPFPFKYEFEEFGDCRSAPLLGQLVNFVVGARKCTRVLFTCGKIKATAQMVQGSMDFVKLIFLSARIRGPLGRGSNKTGFSHFNLRPQNLNYLKFK